MRATFHILNWAHFDQHLHLRLQVLNCWWSQRPRHWNEGSRKELGTVGVILIKWINPQKKRTHFLKNTTKKPSPKSQLGTIRVPVISFTIFYQWFCLPFFWIIFVSPTLGTRKVNALDRHSDTPLSWAARSGHLDAVREDPATKHAKIFWDVSFFHNRRCSWPDLNKIQGRKYKEMHFFQFSCFRRGCKKKVASIKWYACFQGQEAHRVSGRSLAGAWVIVLDQRVVLGDGSNPAMPEVSRFLSTSKRYQL